MELIYEAGEFSIFLTQIYRSTADLAAQVRIMYPLDFEKKKKKLSSVDNEINESMKLKLLGSNFLRLGLWK